MVKRKATNGGSSHRGGTSHPEVLMDDEVLGLKEQIAQRKKMINVLKEFYAVRIPRYNTLKQGYEDNWSDGFLEKLEDEKFKAKCRVEMLIIKVDAAEQKLQILQELKKCEDIGALISGWK